MKKLFILTCILVIGKAATVFAQSPQGIPYQAVARDASGNLVANQNISIRFSILQGSVSGTLIYQETHNATTNNLGLFTVNILQGITTGPFDPLKWEVLAVSGVFMKTEIDITGGTIYTDMGTTQLLSVPFALYSKKSGETFGAVVYKGTWNADANDPDLLNNPHAKGDYYVVSVAGNTNLDGIDDWKVGDWAIHNGSLWQKIDNTDAVTDGQNTGIAGTGVFKDKTGTVLQFKTLTNNNGSVTVQDNTSSIDIGVTFDDVSSATNRTWSSSKISSELLNKEPANPNIQAHIANTSNPHNVTKTQVGLGNVDNTSDLNKPVSTAQAAADAAILSQVSAKVNRAGDTMTGDLVLNADPTAALGAATKQYVDDLNSGLINSYVHRTDDNVTIYLPPGGTAKRFGIGETAPASPLGIKGEPGQDDQMITFTSNDQSQKWNINLNPTGNDVDGFSIDDVTSGSASSRFFIDHVSQGNIGIGTVTPQQKLHIESSVASGITGIKILNTATVNSQGWKMGHLEDASTERNGAFSILEEPSVLPGSPSERMIILSGGNVGINEPEPDTKFHVSRPVSDPNALVDLLEGTGIVVVGPITDNITFDYQGIQARHGNYIGTTLNLTVADLNLQRLGGDILIHGDATIAGKVIITDDAKLGLGTITPSERIDIDGAIKIGNSTNTNNGTIRYTGTDFQGRTGSTWVSLTTGNGPWTPGTGNSIYYDNGSTPRVAIGTATVNATLSIDDDEAVTGENTAVSFHNSSTTSSSMGSDNRVGLGINCSGTWGGSSLSKDIGLYISNVSGQSAPESNLAAVLNGNTVIGDVTSSSMIGTNGTKVLAIQNGTAPTNAIGGSGLPNGGIQIYSESNALGTSVFNVMTGDGAVVKLYRSSAITAPDNAAVNTTYGANEQSVINNMRTRINELENILKAYGLLPP